MSLALTGLFTGTAFAAYATSLLLTDVVRTLLLFYLTPVWSTLLGIAFLGERLTRFRLAALILGFTGLLVVLGLGEGFPWPRNMGDWLALFSGLAWAYGSLRLYRTGGLPVFEQVLVFVLGGLAVLVLAVVLGGEFLAPSPASGSLLDVAPHAFAISIFVLPMLYLTIWPAMRLSPGRVGLLLMSEVVVGVGSAALLAGEPFGLRELSGTLLILSAGAVEVLGQNVEDQNAGDQNVRAFGRRGPVHAGPARRGRHGAGVWSGTRCRVDRPARSGRTWRSPRRMRRHAPCGRCDGRSPPGRWAARS
jgi:drug/metabolite transporter (DMT)-like permease